jgi:tripartite-type tricarboxylate transporter receptor subunit TctC
VLRAPDVIASFQELNIETRANTPEEFGVFVRSQTQMWARVVREANIKLG